MALALFAPEQRSDFDIEREKRRRDYATRVKERARKFYEELEARGENTSAWKIKREPQDMPIIWQLPIRRSVVDE